MHTHTHVATRPGGAWDPEVTWAALALACAWLPLPCEFPAQSAQGGGFCPGRGEVCAGAQGVKRWVLRGLSGLPVLKEGPEISAAPCPAARAAGRGSREQGLWREAARGLRRCCRRASISGTRFLYSIFLVVASLCAEGGSRRLRDWSVCHHCPSVPCVLCQAPPRPPPPASPSHVPGRWSPAHPHPLPAATTSREGETAGPVRAAFCRLGRRS